MRLHYLNHELINDEYRTKINKISFELTDKCWLKKYLRHYFLKQTNFTVKNNRRLTNKQVG